MVNVELRARGVVLTREVVRDVEYEVRRAIDRFQGRVVSVFVRLTDINGHRSGPDVHCSMYATLRGMPPVLVETRPNNLFVAIALCSKKLAGAVRGAVERRKPRRWLPKLTLEVC